MRVDCAQTRILEGASHFSRRTSHGGHDQIDLRRTAPDAAISRGILVSTYLGAATKQDKLEP
jgi:hypothetical protein